MIRALVWLLLCSPALGASGEGPASLERLVAVSERAVRGTVLSREATWIDGRLHTRYAIRVEERILGDAGADEIVVTLPGGSTDDALVRVPGIPLWWEGDEVIVFLRDDDEPALRGLFTVDRDALRDPLGQRTRDFPRRLPELRDRLRRE